MEVVCVALVVVYAMIGAYFVGKKVEKGRQERRNVSEKLLEELEQNLSANKKPSYKTEIENMMNYGMVGYKQKEVSEVDDE